MTGSDGLLSVWSVITDGLESGTDGLESGY
jgi:hypothetical protein